MHRSRIAKASTLALGASLTFLATPASAERAHQKKVDEIVVTATRSETLLDTAPSSVSVVTRETLQNRAFDSLDEALQYEVGVHDGKLRSLPSASQTLVMLNGMPLNSGWFGGVRWDNIAHENVERLEVVRGPGSALYGGNAMGGAINVITRLPDELEMSLRTRIGSDDNRSYGGSIGNVLGDAFAVRLGFEYDQELAGYVKDYVRRPLSSSPGDLTGGFFMPSRTRSDGWIVGDEGERQESQWSVNLAAEYALSETTALRLDGQLGFNDYATGTPNTYLSDADGNPVFEGRVDVGGGRSASVNPGDFTTGIGEERNGSYMLTYTSVIGPVDLVGKVGLQDEIRWYTTPDPEPGEDFSNARGEVREFDTKVYFADVQGTFDLGSRNRITAGLYGRMNTFDQGDYLLSFYRDEDSKVSGKTELTRGTDRYLAVYVQDEIAIVPDRLTAYAGLRYDSWDAYDGESGAAKSPTLLRDASNAALSPSLSLVWDATADTVLRAGIAKAFRAPTIYDLYRTYESSPGRVVYSNPDLEPESLWNYELGVVQYFFDRRLRLGATVYQSDVEDLIYTYTEDDDTYRDNAGRARVRGVEIELRAQPTDGLDLWANYAQSSARITEQPRDRLMEGKRITGMPDRTIAMGVDLTYGRLRAGLAGRHQGRSFRDKYNRDRTGVYTAYDDGWLWDLKLAADIPVEFVALERATVALSIRNLLDEEYYDYYITRGRTLYLDLETAW